MRLVLLALVLVGCVDQAPLPEPEDSSPIVAACDDRALRGCAETNESSPGSCTWCAPVAEACTEEFTPFCAGGVGWCTDSVCRQFCTGFPYCGPGSVPERHPSGRPGADVCVCVPE